jgi:hypothetical protein
MGRRRVAYNHALVKPDDWSFLTMQVHHSWLIGLAVLALANPLQAAELVRQFSGDRSTETAEFEVEGPWLIDWRVNSDFPQTMGIAVSLVNASGAYEGRVFKTKAPANGVRLVEQGGRYYFKVDATVSYWTLRVEQLTPEEAELYQPKSPGPLD